MNDYPTHAQAAAIVLNTALGAGSARAIPAAIAIVDLRDEASVSAAIAAIHRAGATLPLAACPVMIWHRDGQILVGPGGALRVRHLVPDSPSLDVRVHTETGQPARVVISWLDGPGREIVAQRLAALPDTGLQVELVRECFNDLFDDVVDAVFDTASADLPVAAHTVLDRVRAVRDGQYTYFDLLDLATALLRELRRSNLGSYRDALAVLAEVEDQAAVNAVLDDIDTRMRDGQFFPVRVIDDHAMLVALFTLASATARRLKPVARKRIRRQLA